MTKAFVYIHLDQYQLTGAYKAFKTQNVPCKENFCSLLFSGVVLSPGTPQLMSKDILHRLLMSGAKCIIADDIIAERVDQV